jgi:hypothetical protein
MYSPEMETLDQLLGGVVPPGVVRGLYLDDAAFLIGVLGLRTVGDVRLLTVAGQAVPQWRFRDLFIAGAVVRHLNEFHLEMTKQGASRII